MAVSVFDDYKLLAIPTLLSPCPTFIFMVKVLVTRDSSLAVLTQLGLQVAGEFVSLQVFSWEEHFAVSALHGRMEL